MGRKDFLALYACVSLCTVLLGSAFWVSFDQATPDPYIDLGIQVSRPGSTLRVYNAEGVVILESSIFPVGDDGVGIIATRVDLSYEILTCLEKQGTHYEPISESCERWLDGMFSRMGAGSEQ